MTFSTYVKTNGADAVEEYPYSPDQLIYSNPTVSFPMPMPDATLAIYDVFPVEDTPAPSYDPMTENLAMVYPVYTAGRWVQQWSVTQATPAEQEARLSSMRASLACSPLQGKIELDNEGLLDDAEAIIAAADRTTKLAWANATVWRRTSPMIETLGTELGLSANQLDDMFKAAKLIVV